jgi:carbon storage regulator CsrA
MLSLTRYAYKSIMIGDDIFVTVLGVHDGQVTIGIDKPKCIGM